MFHLLLLFAAIVSIEWRGVSNEGAYTKHVFRWVWLLFFLFESAAILFNWPPLPYTVVRILFGWIDSLIDYS